MQTFILLYALNRGFFDFCKEKIFFQLFINGCYSIVYKAPSRAGVPYSQKGCFGKPQKFFLQKVLEIGKTVL